MWDLLCAQNFWSCDDLPVFVPPLPDVGRHKNRSRGRVVRGSNPKIKWRRLHICETNQHEVAIYPAIQLHCPGFDAQEPASQHVGVSVTLGQNYEVFRRKSKDGRLPSLSNSRLEFQSLPSKIQRWKTSKSPFLSRLLQFFLTLHLLNIEHSKIKTFMQWLLGPLSATSIV